MPDGEKIKIQVENLSFFYGSQTVLDQVTVEIADKAITAVIGPSGHGKTTFLMVMNRLWEHIPQARLEGSVLMRLKDQWVDVYAPSVSLPELRRSVGMVFQKPNPLPMSIFNNVAFPLKLGGLQDQSLLERKVEEALRSTFLWEEVKDRLSHDARELSGGQQQRLCIARALMVGPEVLLMDEPTASLDSKAAALIESLITALKDRCTILLVSHFREQVTRLAHKVMLLEGGRLQPF
jgi:phosphate transport system ATP-binding protein